MGRRRVAIYGGTFDPPHLAHRTILELVLKQGLAEEIQILPAAFPPHKQDHFILPFAYRYEMARLAFSFDDRLKLSDEEIDLEGPSYTVETLRSRKKRDPHCDLLLILGADSLRDFPTWREPEAILQMADLLVVPREGLSKEEVASWAEMLRSRWKARIHLLPAPPLPFSSTEIRQQILAAVQPTDRISFPRGKQRPEDPEGLPGEKLEESVLQYILDHGLYAYPDIGKTLQKETLIICQQLERYLWTSMSRYRLEHSLNVQYSCIGLAPYCGLDPNPLAIAGLGHDIAKEYSEEEARALYPWVEDLEGLAKACWHPIVGAYLLKKRFGIMNQTVLEAVAAHQRPDATASRSSELLYIVDKVEPSRVYADLEPIRQALPYQFDLALQLTHEAVDASLRKHQKEER